MPIRLLPILFPRILSRLFLTTFFLILISIFVQNVRAAEIAANTETAEIAGGTETAENTNVSSVADVAANEIISSTISGIITESTTYLSSGGPYIISGRVVIPAGRTLSFAEGSQIFFDDYSGFDVAGILEINGTSGKPVILHNRLSSQQILSEQLLQKSARIKLFTGAKVNIEYAEIAINSGIAIVTDRASLLVDHSKFEGAKLAISTIASDIQITNSIFRNNLASLKILNGTTNISDSSFFNQKDYAIEIKEGSADLSNIRIKDVTQGVGLSVYSPAIVSIIDSQIENASADAIAVSGAAKLTAKNIYIKENDFGVLLTKSSSFYGQGLEILDSRNAGITEIDASEINITDSKIHNNALAIMINHWEQDSSKLSITHSSIYDNDRGFYQTYRGKGSEENENTPPDIENYLKARNNWWGAVSGPLSLQNPKGKGQSVVAGIFTEPWLKSDPFLVQASPSILFLPGFEASRLYNTSSGKRLWEPLKDSQLADLRLDQNGMTPAGAIGVGDTLSEVNLLGGLYHRSIYADFFKFLDTLVDKNTINSWYSNAYDWRYSTYDIVRRGTEINNKLSFENDLAENIIPELIKQINFLVSKSQTVIIVAHSNGGLVAQALLDKLANDKNKGLNNLIDNLAGVIFVAVPTNGTPQGAAVLLHGFGMRAGAGLVMKESTARDVALTLPGSYGLIPNENYFSQTNTKNSQVSSQIYLAKKLPIISFSESVNLLGKYRSAYGDQISNYLDFVNFLTANDGRLMPEKTRVSSPAIISKSIYEKESERRKNILENITNKFPIIQIVGNGQLTLSRINYKSRYNCVSEESSKCLDSSFAWDYEPIYSAHGDGTVIDSSATALAAPIYNIDLAKYNQAYSKNFKHADILEAPVVQDAVLESIKKIKRDEPLSNYIVEPAEKNSWLELIMHSPATLSVYDDFGNHTGPLTVSDSNVEPFSDDLLAFEENIPNSSYVIANEEQYLMIPNTGHYKIKTKGLAVGKFTLEIRKLDHDANIISTDSFRNIVVQPGSVSEVEISADNLISDMNIDYDVDGVFELSVNSVSGSLPLNLPVPNLPTQQLPEVTAPEPDTTAKPNTAPRPAFMPVPVVTQVSDRVANMALILKEESTRPKEQPIEKIPDEILPEQASSSMLSKPSVVFKIKSSEKIPVMSYNIEEHSETTMRKSEVKHDNLLVMFKINLIRVWKKIYWAVNRTIDRLKD